MAPIHSTSIFVTRQIVDDDQLRTLRKVLEDLKIKGPLTPDVECSNQLSIPLDIEHLVSLLEPWKSWPFEEQVSQKLTKKIRLMDGNCHLNNDIFATPYFNFSRWTYKNGWIL
jgi:hypothetical protein